ncbi:MAG: DUF4349 domain-containing protein, partial [Saprospiraceae bacterium]|nr:DUF4349 domain-containing protein [Saprospiraceae bacterium]
MLNSCDSPNSTKESETVPQYYNDLNTRFDELLKKNHIAPILTENDFDKLPQIIDKESAPTIKKILAQYTPSMDSITNDSTPKNPDTLVSPPPQKTLQNGALLLKVRDYKESYSKIYDLVNQYDAEIVDQDERNSDTLVENTLIIQTPQANFSSLVNDLRELSVRVQRSKIWIEDVTVQFANLESRLKFKEKTWIKLSKHKQDAAEQTDLSSTIRELNLIAEDIHTLDSIAVLLSQRATYSRLTVTFYENLEKPIPVQADFGDRFSGSLSSGWTNFQEFTLQAASIWPYLI